MIVILGPTASGKSALAVKLAKKFGGEIISADSRQVYQSLDVGSGKITKKEMRGVPHHLLDVANPKRRFTVAQYQKLATTAIKKIQRRGKVPFLVGGTGFYIQSIAQGIVIPEVKPNWKLRAQLEKKSVEALFKMLKKLDPARAKTIDPQNPRRLVRAIEIVKATGKPIEALRIRSGQNFEGLTLKILQIGIKKSPQELKKLISTRLQKRINGIIAEVEKLHKNGLPWKRLEELGLEYRFVAQYIQNDLTRREMISKIQIESEHFAKRQMTWFKRNKKIHWIKTQKEAEKLTQKFLQ